MELEPLLDDRGLPPEHEQPESVPRPGPGELERDRHGDLCCPECEVPVALPPAEWCRQCRAGVTCPQCGGRWWPDGSRVGWAERGAGAYPRRSRRAAFAYRPAEHPTLALVQSVERAARR